VMLADAVDRDRLVATFLELVAIDSPTGHEEKIGRELSARFSELGCQVSQDEVGNLIAVLRGTRADAVLVATHMDTVGSDIGIQPIIADGIIRTDGSTILGADDKSGIAGCLEVLRLLRANPEIAHPTIEFVVTVGEERGLVGSRHMDVRALSASYGFVFDTPRVIGSITYWAPTEVDITVMVHGRKAHAGVEPEKGVNAVRVAAEAISSMPLGRIDDWQGAPARGAGGWDHQMFICQFRTPSPISTRSKALPCELECVVQLAWRCVSSAFKLHAGMEFIRIAVFGQLLGNVLQRRCIRRINQCSKVAIGVPVGRRSSR
jgi:peptidase T-like protein